MVTFNSGPQTIRCIGEDSCKGSNVKFIINAGRTNVWCEGKASCKDLTMKIHARGYLFLRCIGEDSCESMSLRGGCSCFREDRGSCPGRCSSSGNPSAPLLPASSTASLLAASSGTADSCLDLATEAGRNAYFGSACGQRITTC